MKNKIINLSLTILISVSIITSLIVPHIFHYLKSLIWGITTVLMLFCGFYFSKKLKFPQLNFKMLFKALKPDKRTTSDIKPLESLTMNLAAKIGVGSLAGIAIAIYLGGPGSIFWMWVCSIICAINTFVESLLGVYYQEQDQDGHYEGGPAYYIKKGLKDNYLACLYAIIIIFAYIIGFLSIQSNTIVSVVNTITNINPWFITITIGLIAAFVILKGVKSIAKFTSQIVPIMGLLYLGLGLIILYQNISSLPQIISLIFKSAFNLQSLSGGLIGTIIIGIQRGIFATESGLGTSAISSATSKSHPLKQGYLQVWGIHFTTFIICTITALIILTSNYLNIPFSNVNGIEITSYAFQEHLGSWGIIALSLITILFAFSTIISGYYYGEANLKFLFPHITPRQVTIFKLITIILVITGGIIHANIIWNIVDLFVAFLSLINLYALFALKKVVFALTNKPPK